MGIMAAIRRRLGRAHAPAIPYADPYVLAQWRASVKPDRNRFTVTPQALNGTITEASADPTPFTVTIADAEPYDYASWADTVPASGEPHRTG